MKSCGFSLLPRDLLRKEGNVLFNDAHDTFYLGLYGVGHMVKDHSDSERGNPLSGARCGPIELFLVPASAPRLV